MPVPSEETIEAETGLGYSYDLDYSYGAATDSSTITRTVQTGSSGASTVARTITFNRTVQTGSGGASTVARTITFNRTVQTGSGGASTVSRDLRQVVVPNHIFAGVAQVDGTTIGAGDLDGVTVLLGVRRRGENPETDP